MAVGLKPCSTIGLRDLGRLFSSVRLSFLAWKVSLEKLTSVKDL